MAEGNERLAKLEVLTESNGKRIDAIGTKLESVEGIVQNINITLKAGKMSWKWMWALGTVIVGVVAWALKK